jgi:hypoxanthine phosphoribosyltransferase
MTAATPRLADALKTADVLVDRAAVMAAIARIGTELDHDYASIERPVFITIMHGGLPFAGHLALATRIDFEFDYLHATRYRGATEGGSLHWIKTPNANLRGRQVLLVDDILDEGHTLLGIREYCESQGAAGIKIAALCRKLHDRCVPGIKADYVGLEVVDRYVFGFGMDYHEQGRNLPGIYAI